MKAKEAKQEAKDRKAIRYYCVTCKMYISSETYMADHMDHDVADLAEKCTRFLAEYQKLSRMANLMSDRRQVHIKDESIDGITADIKSRILQAKATLQTDINKSVEESAEYVQKSPLIQEFIRAKAELAGKDDEQLTQLKQELAKFCRQLLVDLAESKYESADKMVDPEKLKNYEEAIKRFNEQSSTDVAFIQEMRKLKQTKVEYAFNPLAVLGMIHVDSAVKKPARIIQVDREHNLFHIYNIETKSVATTKITAGFILPFRFVTVEAFNNVYLNGGDNDHSVFLKSHYLYDELRGTLVPLADMNEPRSRHALAAAEGKLYALGGENACGVTGHCEYYEPAENRWTVAPALNDARCGLSACAVGNTVYAVGGWNKDYILSIERLSGKHWESVKLGKKAPLKPLQVAGLVHLKDDEMLIFGGYGENETLSKEVYVLNTKSLALTKKKELQGEGEAFIASETRKEGDLVCAFGYEKGGVHIYDSVKDEWTFVDQANVSK